MAYQPNYCITSGPHLVFRLQICNDDNVCKATLVVTYYICDITMH